MNIEKLISFCKLKGCIDRHEQFTDHPKLWMMRLLLGNKIITFDYYKDPDTDGLTFCSGRISTHEGKLGTMSTAIESFDHLLELL